MRTKRPRKPVRAPLAPGVAVALAAIFVAAPGPGQDRQVVIREATILPVSAAPLPRGSVSFRDGIITAVGADITAERDAVVVDGTGHYVLPGIVDVHSHLGVSPWPWVPGNSDVNEDGGDPLTPHLRAIDAFDSADPAIRWVAAGGVTTIMVLPGSANVVGGQAAVMKLRLGRSAAGMLFEGAPRIMKIAVGENPKLTYGARGRMPSTRMGVIALLRDALSQAQVYRDRWDAWNAAAAADRGPAPGFDPKLDALADMLRGEIQVAAHTYRRDEFLALLQLSDEFGFELGSFHHAMDAYRLGPELARRGVGVAVYADAFGRKLEHWEQVPQTAAYLSSLGALVTLHSDFPFFAQRLHIEAAKLVRYGGISQRDALKTVTLSAARLIGVDAWVGSLEAGKHADIAVYDRHPFDSFARVEKTFVDGELVFDRVRDRAWLERTP